MSQWSDLQRRLPALAKGVLVAAGTPIPGDRVEVYPAGDQWRYRSRAGGKNVGNPGERLTHRAHASRQAITHGSAWLPVYRRERDGSWTFLRAPLLGGFGEKK